MACVIRRHRPAPSRLRKSCLPPRCPGFETTPPLYSLRAVVMAKLNSCQSSGWRSPNRIRMRTAFGPCVILALRTSAAGKDVSVGFSVSMVPIQTSSGPSSSATAETGAVALLAGTEMPVAIETNVAVIATRTVRIMCAPGLDPFLASGWGSCCTAFGTLRVAPPYLVQLACARCHSASLDGEEQDLAVVRVPAVVGDLQDVLRVELYAVLAVASELAARPEDGRAYRTGGAVGHHACAAATGPGP